jgi:hypothetical protein
MSDEWWLLILAAIPLFLLWLLTLSEVGWRRRLPIPRRIAWIAALMVVPLPSLAVYIIVRPPRTRPLGTWRSPSRPQGGNRRAASLVLLAEEHAAGEVGDAAYDATIHDVTAGRR